MAGDDKTKQLIEQLENGIRDTLSSERYRRFLEVQSQFHSYSFNNQMLIFLQSPDATRVAGFNSWKKLGRYVKRGEHGISILAPSPYKYETMITKLDPKTKQPIKDLNGEVVKEKAVQEGLRFVKVSVFDISQTEGKALPEICSELKGNSAQAQNIIRAIKQIANIPIIEERIRGAKGYFDRDRNLIALNEGMPADQTAKTLVHEFAHATVHRLPNPNFDRATIEVQAESIAYVVSNHFGLDTSAYSFDYLASWSSGRNLPELKKSFELIQKTSNDIINKMEGVLSNALALENSPREHMVNRNQLQPVVFPQESPVVPTVKDKIVGLYSKEFPAISHITEKTAQLIENLNSQRDKTYTIRGIKQAYTMAGKKLEEDIPSPGDIKVFSNLKEIVDDLKHAQVVGKREELNQRASQTQSVISKSMDMDMDMAR